MNRNPIIPFAIIAVIGILLMISMSFYGLNKGNELAGGEEEVTEVPADPEAIFQQTCASCHGQDLGGVGTFPSLQQVGAKYSADEIKNIIANGIGTMPPGLLQGEAADKVAEWLAEKK